MQDFRCGAETNDDFFPTVKRELDLVWVRALFYPSWSCPTLSWRVSSFCWVSHSWIGVLLVFLLIFLPVLLWSHYLPILLMYDMVSMESGSLYPLSFDIAQFLPCFHMSHSVGILGVVHWKGPIHLCVCRCAHSGILSGCFWWAIVPPWW